MGVRGDKVDSNTAELRQLVRANRAVRANDQTDDTRAIRAFNDFAVTDKRVELVMLPVSDGLTIARKL